MAKARPHKRWQQFVSDDVYDTLRRNVNFYWFVNPQEVEDQVFKDAEDILATLDGAKVSLTGIEEALTELLNGGVEVKGSEFSVSYETSSRSCEVILDHDTLPIRVRFHLKDLAELLFNSTKEFTP